MTIALLEHINLAIRDGGEVTSDSAHFYLEILGCARDPRLEWMVHANIGLGQFHILPKQPNNQRINGHIALFYTDLNALQRRLSELNYPFDVKDGSDVQSGIEAWNFENAAEMYTHLSLQDPSGNSVLCFKSPLGYVEESNAAGSHPGERAYGDGLAYIKFLVKPGSSEGISSFYREFLGAKASVGATIAGTSNYCSVHCGRLQRLIFEEINSNLHAYDGHHICIYIHNFEKAYHALAAKQLIWTNPVYEDNCDTWEKTKKWNQFRILNIINPSSNETVLQLEHEVRPLSHSRCPLR